MPLFRPRPTEVFDDAFNRLAPADQEAVQHLINLLCIDPQPDGRTRRVFELPQGAVVCANSDNHWVSYQITSDDEIRLIGCGGFPST